MYREKLKPKHGRQVTLAIGVIFFLLCSPILLFTGLVKDDCFLGSHGTSLIPPLVIEMYSRIMLLLILVIVPFMSIAFLNCLIVYKLKQSKLTISKNEKEVTVSLIMVSLFYLCMNTLTTIGILTSSTGTFETQREILKRKIIILFAVSLNFICLSTGFHLSNFKKT